MKTAPHKINTDFERAFSEVEQLLKRRLKLSANNHTGITELRDQYARNHPYRMESADRLKTLGDIRNILVHQSDLKNGCPFTVTPSLTKSGTNRTPIEGIVTQWDSARYFN